MTTQPPVIAATRSAAGKLTPIEVPETKGPEGDPWSNGWTPVIAGEDDGTRTLNKVIDWTGGTGTKPATGMYIGTTGYVASKAQAYNYNKSKRADFFVGTSSALTGIATIAFSPAFPAAPKATAFAFSNVLAGSVKAEIVAGSLTASGCQVKVTAANLVSGIFAFLAGATVVVLTVEA